MAKSLVIAIVALSYLLIIRVISGIHALYIGGDLPKGIYISLAISIVVLIGIIKGNRLAWQWARLVSLLGALIATVRLDLFLINKAQPGKLYLSLMLIQTLALYLIFFTLSARGSRVYFGLVCPGCGESKIKASGLLFQNVICKKCGRGW